ncbi:xylulose kinase [Enemella evansiae]|uniref:xylulokinase n=1 Tax=Enemella evansiae TaxID=2016499 RepID=UPI000B95E6CA|nr:FGGY family carbohydrate kinase [Enemella evansiae]OYO09415.1 xylulose kinase [Enemella evansiae]
MRLVAGIDSSTQSCKVVIREAESGRAVREGAARHPDGTEVHPDHWWTALQEAIHAAGGLDDVEAVAVGGQQHGMVCLDESGEVVRPALLWNDTRSAGSASELVEELGGSAAWAEAVGSVPVASLTITKLRWLAEHEPHNAERTAAVALPHDWLTWRLRGTGQLEDLVTDRSDASGTGYFDGRENDYRRDLLAMALGSRADDLVLPRVLGPADPAGEASALTGAPTLGPGCGDNAGAALGLGLDTGQTSLSIGTSGVVASVSAKPTADASGLITGFSDATGAFLPLACTLNGSRILDAAARVLGVDHAGVSRLALAAAPGAGGLTLVPYLEGERTPNRPDATGTLHGLTLDSLTRENYARAAVEGLLGLMAFGLAAIREQGVTVERVTLVGGAARSEAVRRIAPAMLGLPVDVPPPGEYVANGAAVQAAWVLSGERPRWDLGQVQTQQADPTPQVLERYLSLAED